MFDLLKTTILVVILIAVAVAIPILGLLVAVIGISVVIFYSLKANKEYKRARKSTKVHRHDQAEASWRSRAPHFRARRSRAQEQTDDDVDNVN